jgi:hypothetical protein
MRRKVHEAVATASMQYRINWLILRESLSGIRGMRLEMLEKKFPKMM